MSTLVQHHGNDSTTFSNAASVSISALATGSLVIVPVFNEDGRAVISVTDGVNTYIQGVSCPADYVEQACDIWYCLSAIGGPTSITVNFNGSPQTYHKGIFMYEYSGVTLRNYNTSGGISAIGSTIGGLATNTAPLLTVNPSYAGISVAINRGRATVVANPKGGNVYTGGGDTSGGATTCSIIFGSGNTTLQAAWEMFNNQAYASSAISFSTGLTPAASGSGIYKLIPDKRHDTVYVTISSDDPPIVTTEDVAIPRPSAKTGYLGDEQ